MSQQALPCNRPPPPPEMPKVGFFMRIGVKCSKNVLTDISFRGKSEYFGVIRLEGPETCFLNIFTQTKF